VLLRISQGATHWQGTCSIIPIKMRVALKCALLVALAAAACSSGDDNGTSNQPAPVACEVKIERFKELLVVDDAVVTDARSHNDVNGPWSFRHAVEEMTPQGKSSSDFIMEWIESWATARQFNGYSVDREAEDREFGIRSRLICPWLKSTPENNCDANCTTCTAKNLDLSKAPFRLLAIAHRPDLAGKPLSIAKAGEGRLIFGFTEGPGDDPASLPLALAVIFEYGLPDTMSLEDWTKTWHSLGSHADFDESYKTELQAVTDKFTTRGSFPSRQNGSAISQVRTNESAFNWVWQLREFTLDTTGQLRLSATKNSPAEALNKSAELEDFVRANKDKFANEEQVVPTFMLGGSANALQFKWSLPNIDEPTRMAFAKTTCNGCHAGENPTVDNAFHVSPRLSGIAKLSRFVNNPDDPKNDELGKREALMSQRLCAAPSP
jgi:hypothetical protein